jgi:hypothetical protein
LTLIFNAARAKDAEKRKEEISLRVSANLCGLCVKVLLHLISWLKTKNPPPSGSGLINFLNESKPRCRAGKQRAGQQQVQIQIAIHNRQLIPDTATGQWQNLQRHGSTSRARKN